MIKRFFLTLFVFLFLCFSAFAENFYIQNYDVDLKVDKTKTVHVTEIIDVYFTRSSHGMFRDISAPNAEVTNIQVSEKYKVLPEIDKYSIQIGDADKYVNGAHTYKISYDYKFFDNKNEFYFNIIGVDTQTNINHVKFKVEMPEKIEDSKTGLSIGKYGTEGFSERDGEYYVTDTMVTGETCRVLEPREGVTIRIEVPKGYFVNNLVSKQNVSMYLMLLLTLACIIVWFIYGKDKKPIPVVNFYPPEKMNPLDVELIYNENVSTKGVVGMVVDLAQRGYLTIAEKKDGFVIEKGKEYDGSNEFEKTLINAIFEGVKQTATEKHLKTSKTFYKTVVKILADKMKEKDKLFEPEESNKSIRKAMRYIIIVLWIVLSFICANFSFWDVYKGLIIAGTGIIGQMFVGLCVFDEKTRNPIPTIIFMLILNLILVLPFYVGLMVTFNTMYYVYPMSFWGYLCMFISIICYYNLQTRTQKANLILGELEGLKKFIKTAEINKLQMLADENPQYFYRILPYAYIFDLSDKWIKNFENIVKPDFVWSEGTVFNERGFNSFMDTMNKFSRPSYDNGGVSRSSGGGGSYHHSSGGGGGHSGGGGGGGGCRSW